MSARDLLQDSKRRAKTTAEFRAHNSAVECVLHTDEVVGSIPTAPTPKSRFAAMARSALESRFTRRVRFVRARPERNVPAVALEGMAKSSSGLLVAGACSLAMLSCAGAAPRGPAAPIHDHWLPGYVLGIWGKSELDVRDDCPDTGAASVRVGATWATLAITVVTLGIYTPREVRVQCRAHP